MMPSNGNSLTGRQFDMGEAHVGDIVDQLLGQFQIAQHPVARRAPPGPQMHLVDRDRRVDRCAAAARAFIQSPSCQSPPNCPDNRGICRRMFRPEPDRIGLQRQQRAARPLDLVFVGRAFAQAGNEDLPHAGRAPPAHRVAAAVPDVEIAHHATRVRAFGAQTAKCTPVHALMRDRMRAKHLPEPPVRAFAQQVFVHLAQHRAEAVGIVEFPCRAMALARASR